MTRLLGIFSRVIVGNAPGVEAGLSVISTDHLVWS